MNVAFLSSFPPKICGVGEFCNDLIISLSRLTNSPHSTVYAIDDRKQGYAYPPLVKKHFYYQNRDLYKKIAIEINAGDTDLCLLQHEFNLFGGNENEYILDFIEALQKPLVVVMHNISTDQNDKKYASRISHIKRMINKVSMFIATCQFGKDILISVGADPRKITVIFHGAPVMPPISDVYHLKKKFSIEHNFTVMQFGIFSPRKNVEQVLEAISLLKVDVPNVKYLLIGLTSPRCPIPYLELMKQYAKKLKVDKEVSFIEKYLQKRELYEYITASDVVVTPYLRVDQISSGPLTFAVGAGTPVVSTPYLYAKELLKNIGILVPFGDTKKLAITITQLAKDSEFYKKQKTKTLEFGKTLSWDKKAAEYMNVFEQFK